MLHIFVEQKKNFSSYLMDQNTSANECLANKSRNLLVAKVAVGRISEVCSYKLMFVAIHATEMQECCFHNDKNII